MVVRASGWAVAEVAEELREGAAMNLFGSGLRGRHTKPHLSEKCAEPDAQGASMRGRR